MFGSIHAQNSKHVWYFGEGLGPGNEFTYKICDFVLRIPESPDPCYTITMGFVALLKNQGEKTWVVSAHVNHKVRSLDMIFHISNSSFEIKTDGANIPYAKSIQRTLGLVKQFANENKPQILEVGESWGKILADTTTTDIMIDQIDSLEFGGSLEQTYLLSYILTKESHMHIKDDFPFPIKAEIYKPISSHQNVPLEFTLELINYRPDGFSMCMFTNTSNEQVIESSQGDKYRDFVDLLSEESEDDMHIQSPNNTDVETFTVDDLLGSTNENSTIQQLLKEAYGDNYKQRLQQAVHNFTKFIEMISHATGAVLED